MWRDHAQDLLQKETRSERKLEAAASGKGIPSNSDDEDDGMKLFGCSHNADAEQDDLIETSDDEEEFMATEKSPAEEKKDVKRLGHSLTRSFDSFAQVRPNDFQSHQLAGPTGFSFNVAIAQSLDHLDRWIVRSIIQSVDRSIVQIVQ